MITERNHPMVFQGSEGTNVHLFTDEGNCTMSVGYNEKEKWATIYSIETKPESQGKGHADAMVRHFTQRFKGYKLGSTVALHPAMSHMIEKYKLIEYK